VAARLVTVEQCNDENILVFFDADVIIGAIRDSSGAHLANLLRLRYALRRYTSTTLYEVAFSQKKSGHDLSRLKKNQQWLNDHISVRVPLDEAVADEFERSITAYATGLRGKADLGDALLACACQAHSSVMSLCAIATINGRDYRALPVALVRDFLPVGFVLDE
jgi:predicted nucleic acid-binding protein